MISDNDPSFTSQVFHNLIRPFGVKHWTTLPYHPQGNSPVERFHRTLKEVLVKIAHAKWHAMDFQEALNWALLHYRSVPHSAIGDSPAFVTYGRDILIHQDFILEDTVPQVPISPLDTPRLTIMGIIRQAIRQRVEVAIAKTRKEEENQKATCLWPNNLITYRLNPTEIAHRAGIMECSKIISEWSYPARVITTNHDGTRADVKLLTTGTLRRVALADCVVLESPPEGSILRDLNEEVLATSPDDLRHLPP